MLGGVGLSGFFSLLRSHLVGFASRHARPTISSASNVSRIAHAFGLYVASALARILIGCSPAKELPA